jgi:TetR/AcrR family transcriptional repressor of lmrAB and yxaGH operons
MPKSTRERVLETTCDLLEVQGYHATGLNQIIEESGTPKGSLYYYFPGGKEALAAEAIQKTGEEVEARIVESLDAVTDPARAVRCFIKTLARHVAASEYRAGGPITTVALEVATTSERLNSVCRETYDRWQQAFKAKLIDGGAADAEAVQLSTLIIAALEGAIILSRTRRDTAPLQAVAEQLERLVAAQTGGQP